MSLVRKIICMAGILFLFLANCNDEPTSVIIPDPVIIHDTITNSNIADTYYTFAAQRLEQYLIYRDRLPSDLYSFPPV